MADKTFPSSTLFHYPILQLLADGKVHTKKEMVKLEIKMLSISEEDQQVLTPGGENKKGRNKVESWTHYAVTDLKQADYIFRCENGYAITKSGLAFYNEHKGGFVANELQASKTYRKYKNKGEFSKPRVKKNASTKVSEPLADPTPDINIKPSISHTLDDSSKTKEEGVVYILTNPAFKTYYIKIGYTTNIQERLRELYNTSVPLPFKVFALMNTNKYKQAEKMIHAAFKSSRIGDDREFFMVKPEEALDQMKVVAEGLEATVIQYDDKGDKKKIIDYSKK